jgi:hypothetical protein
VVRISAWCSAVTIKQPDTGNPSGILWFSSFLPGRCRTGHSFYSASLQYIFEKRTVAFAHQVYIANPDIMADDGIKVQYNYTITVSWFYYSPQ